MLKVFTPLFSTDQIDLDRKANLGLIESWIDGFYLHTFEIILNKSDGCSEKAAYVFYKVLHLPLSLYSPLALHGPATKWPYRRHQ